jgi:Kelch motif/Galactose oxidase, central domain
MRALSGILVVLTAINIAYESASYCIRSTVLANSASVGSVSPAAHMLEPRSGHTATLLPDGKVLIAGGMRRNQDFYRSAELFDPASGKFQPTGEMTIARVGQAAVLLHSGKVLVIGGWIGHGCTDSAELYDPTTGKFTALSKMTGKRGQPSATLLGNGDVLITGGAERDAPGGVASAEIFRAALSKFEPVGPMHFARISQTATVLNDGRVLIAGGRGDSVTASAEIYDPKTKQFTVTGSMLTARYKHTAGLLPDGRVLIAGGSDDRDWHGKMNSAEIYDPRTGQFCGTSPLNDSRFKLPEEAAELASGQILIGGGSKTVEVYDPISGKFLIAAGQMTDARHFMTETRLKNGSVLLAGGYPNNDQGTTETWIYHP